MVFFITVLRALAACVITNSHYTGIYPTDLIANGGLLGDIIFFAVSGYCLYNIRLNFLHWYGKRIYRVYVPTILITLIYLVLGFYSASGIKSALGLIIYPTYYHFVASIVFLYIPFYFCMKVKQIKNHLGIAMIVVALAWLLVYIFAFDKSYYHIDYVYSWMIRFLFGEAMLLGAWFRQNDSKFRNKFKWYYPVISVFMFMGYFASKMAFSRYESISQYQFANQIIIFVLLYFVFATFASLDEMFERMPLILKKVIQFISNMTLEIYVVQYVLEDLIRGRLPFPINWLVLTISIIVVATILHYISKAFYLVIDNIFQSIKGNKRGELLE